MGGKDDGLGDRSGLGIVQGDELGAWTLLRVMMSEVRSSDGIASLLWCRLLLFVAVPASSTEQTRYIQPS